MPHHNPATGLDRPIPARDRWLLLGLLALAALLRFYKIGQQSLTTDEVMSIAMVTQVESGMMYFSHGPLHSVLLQLWSIWWGMSDVWTRCLSAVLGLATIPAIYVLGRRLAGNRVALLAALLLSVSSFHVWYSQEVRNYALLMGLATASQLLFLRVLQGARWTQWAGLGLMSVALILTNLAGSFLIAAQGAYLLFFRRRHLLPFALVQILAVVILLPWLIHSHTAPDAGGLVSAGPLRHTNFHPLALPFAFSVFSVGFTVGPSLDEMNRSLSLELIRPHLWYFTAAALLFGALFLRGWWRLRDQVHGRLFFALWLFVPLGIVTLLAVFDVKVFNPRYAAVAFPAYILILARGLSSLRRPVLIPALLLVLAANGLSLWNHYENPRHWRPDARRAAAYVNENLEAGDCVLVYTLEKPFRRYYEGTPALDRIPWVVPTSQEHLGRYLDPRLDACRRIWLVDYRGWYLDPERRIERELEHRWGLVAESSFVGMKVSLYAPPSSRGEGRGPRGQEPINP